MKQATGELNATVVVVLSVGVLMAFFYYTLWPVLRKNFEENAKCSKAVCEPCDNGTDCDYVTCYSKNKDHTPQNAFECVYKG